MLNNAAVTLGTYYSTFLTVNSEGRLTGITAGSVTGTSPITVTGNSAGSSTVSLATSGVTAGSYTNSILFNPDTWRRFKLFINSIDTKVQKL